MFEPDTTWMHAKAPDIAIRIIQVDFKHRDYWRVTCQLYNPANGISYEIRAYKIMKHQFRFWRCVLR